jgi:thymidylate kinase
MYGFNIILDGCDSVGKTTLFEYILRQGILNQRLTGQHYSAPKNMEHGRQQYIAGIKILNRIRGLIFDRFMLGERVYAPIMRGYAPVYMNELESKLKSHNFLFLLICSDLDVLKKRFDGEFIKESQLITVQNKYIEEFAKSEYENKFIIDTVKMSVKEEYDFIVKTIKEVMKEWEKLNI